MATKPGKGKPFPPRVYRHGSHSITLAADGAIKVKAGDTISKYCACLYGDALMGWEEFGRFVGTTLKKLDDPNKITTGETVYHMPTYFASISVTAITVTDATRVASVGNAGIIHFVTPKGSGAVQLTAVISPDTPATRAVITWDGATAVGGNPLASTVPRTAAGKFVVKIKASGTVIQELRVWVVWSTITAPTGAVVPVSDAHRGGVEFPWKFTHRITPATIITDADRPALNGPMNAAGPVPGHAKTHIVNGNPLGGGASLKWDCSRQIRLKILDPKGFLTGVMTQQLSFPADDAEGNDDTHNTDEDNNPYDNFHGDIAIPFLGVLVPVDLRDQLTSEDKPFLKMPHAMGADGDTVELRMHFREFTRLQLGTKWNRISDWFLWRVHIKLRRTAGKWANNGSTTAADNAGF
ncbi:MAG: hypothetical protein H6970_07280 [Gammaproteobacteria bacterium]|nr:hypothetical protein [Gammaproteobacteria bacterium]MCP5424856.1 hypothetical protein [Gammaproteobacteria bacterium]MCP5458167.1 hypothetical protein [Gammaproteobacteria bacterium]